MDDFLPKKYDILTGKVFIKWNQLWANRHRPLTRKYKKIPPVM